MVKTRSQSRNIKIKKEEEEEEDCKPILVLQSVRIIPRITKRRRPKRNSRNLPAQDIKVEEDTNTKSMLQSSSKNPNLPKGQQVSQEQIDQLFDYILNENMSVTKASRMVKLSQSTGSNYYNMYKNDPEKKIPTARRRYIYTNRVFTQEHVENLIRYIVDDKMSLAKASEKANIGYRSAHFYYKKYLDDPDHKIPIPFSGQYCTQEQKEAFIGYIVNDKMSIRAASKKAKIDLNTAKKTCNKYFNSKDPIIPAPSHIAPIIRYTQEQIKDVIRYIVNDKMTIKDASRKANMCSATAKRHYYQYLKDHNMEVPAPKVSRSCTQEDKNELIRLIFEEKMSTKAAAKKVPMYYSAALQHYHQYVKDHNIDIAPKYTQDQINQLIGYIMDDKMTKKDAAKKANMPYCAAEKYHRQYLNDNNIVLPGPKYTQARIDELIGYIVDDKMGIMAASKKANIPITTASRFYRKYLVDHNLDIPVPKTITQDQIDEFISYIVDDKMTVKAASKKANICAASGSKHYRRYLKKNNLFMPPPKCTQEQVDEMIGYVVDDKMTLIAATKKAKMSEPTGRKYYRQYRRDHSLDILNSTYTTQDKINELIGYIVDDEMTVLAASRKANMCSVTGRKYYREYLKEHNLDVPIRKRFTQDEIDEFIGYVVRDKMSVKAASRKANMASGTGHLYYHKYLNNQNHRDKST